MPHYLDFDLEAFGHRQTETADRFSVRVQASPVGEQRIEQAVQVEMPIAVRQGIAALRQRRLPWAEMVAVGEELGRALFPPAVRSFLKAALKCLAADDRLRIRLKLDTYALAELPWEYAYLPLPDAPADRRGPGGFLVLDRRISLVRYESQEGPLVPIDPGSGTIRLVALLADPDDPDYERLDVQRERSGIEDALAGLPAIRPDFYSPATADALMEALVTPAQIFHFAGHGQFVGDMGERYGSEEGEGAVVLVDEAGRARPLPAQHLALALTGCGVRLAVLTACEGGQRDAANPWAGVVTALTRCGIPAVVGMQFGIRDANANLFSRAFYRALAAGQPIDAAVTDGRIAIDTQAAVTQAAPDERDWGVPVLYLRAEDGVLFPGRTPQPGPRPAPPVSSLLGTPAPQPAHTKPRANRAGAIIFLLLGLVATFFLGVSAIDALESPFTRVYPDYIFIVVGMVWAGGLVGTILGARRLWRGYTKPGANHAGAISVLLLGPVATLFLGWLAYYYARENLGEDSGQISFTLVGMVWVGGLVGTILGARRLWRGY